MALPTTRRQAAATDLLNRLGFIQVAKGYNTDAGLNVFAGFFPSFGPDDPEAGLAVMFNDDTVQVSGGTMQTRVPFAIWAITKAPEGTEDQPLLTIEAIIADIRAAVEIEAEGSIDRYLGVMETPAGQRPATLPKGFSRGVTRGLVRPEGAGFVGAAVEYIAEFEERWGESRGGEDS